MVSHFRGEAEIIFTTNHDSCRELLAARSPELTLGNQTQREGDFFARVEVARMAAFVSRRGRGLLSLVIPNPATDGDVQ